MSSATRPVLRIKAHTASSVLARAYAVHAGMSANPTRFTAPTPPLPELHDQIAKVEDPDKQTKAGIKGAAKQRNLQLKLLVRMLRSQCAYVRSLCDASPDEAEVIIQESGFSASAASVREQPLLKVSLAAAAGTVFLDAAVAVLMNGKLGKSRCFDWEWTADGGKTYTAAPSTPTGTATISGLPSLTTVGFRVRARVGSIPGAWSPTVSVIVH